MATLRRNTFKNEAARFLGRLIPASRRAALAGLIPETNWETLEISVFEQVMQALECLDPDAINPEILRYIKKRKCRIGTFAQASSGAGWTVLGNVTIRPDDVQRHLQPYVLSLILHEIFHLQQQSIPMRLSMQGELAAWQYQYRVYPLLKPGHEIGEVYGGKSREWEQLSQLQADSREDLKTAQGLMKEIAKGYRSDLLPIYPMPQEISYCWRQGGFKCVMEMLQALVSGIRGGEKKPAPSELVKP